MIGLAEWPQSRKGTVTEPFDAVGLAYTDRVREADTVLCGRRRAGLLKYRKPLWYRLRGNLWRDRENTLWKQLIDTVSWRAFRGVIAPGPRLQRLVKQHTRFETVPIIPVPVNPTAWPQTQHTDESLRMLSLTNADYVEKVIPIVDRVEAINEWCELNDSVWWIAGDGTYSDALRASTAETSHVHYLGYVNPRRWLQHANVLLHFSTMDVQTPNAILEGMASELPVLTTEFFQAPPVDTVSRVSDLWDTLGKLQQPSYRRQRVCVQTDYLQANHTPRVVGQQYKQVLA